VAIKLGFLMVKISNLKAITLSNSLSAIAFGSSSANEFLSNLAIEHDYLFSQHHLWPPRGHWLPIGQVLQPTTHQLSTGFICQPAAMNG